MFWRFLGVSSGTRNENALFSDSSTWWLYVWVHHHDPRAPEWDSEMLLKWRKAQLDIYILTSPWSNHPLPLPHQSAKKVWYSRWVVPPFQNILREGARKFEPKVNETNDQNKYHSHKLHPFTNKRRMWHVAPSVVARERLEILPSCPSVPTEKGCALRVRKHPFLGLGSTLQQPFSAERTTEPAAALPLSPRNVPGLTRKKVLARLVSI